MTQALATLREMIEALDGLNPETALGFTGPAGEIDGGYHITEVKRADIRSIDCGGRESRWVEAHLQLLDGPGGAWLTAGKVAAILRRSVAALPDLADAPLSIEFGHGNAGLARFRLGELQHRDGHTLVSLVAETAQCKPAVDFVNRGPVAQAGCCAPSQKARTPAGCC